MQRTNIYLTEEERRLLSERARQEGTTMAAVVRTILDRELGLAGVGVTVREAIDNSAGVWQDRTDQDIEELRRLRSHGRFERLDT